MKKEIYKEYTVTQETHKLNAITNLLRLAGDIGIAKDLSLGTDLDLDLNLGLDSDPGCSFRGAGDREPLMQKPSKIRYSTVLLFSNKLLADNLKTVIFTSLCFLQNLNCLQKNLSTISKMINHNVKSTKKFLNSFVKRPKQVISSHEVDTFSLGFFHHEVNGRVLVTSFHQEVNSRALLASFQHEVDGRVLVTSFHHEVNCGVLVTNGAKNHHDHRASLECHGYLGLFLQQKRSTEQSK